MNPDFKRCLVAAAAAWASMGARAEHYAIVDLGVEMIPSGINNAGFVAGTRETGGPRALEWRNGKWQRLDKTPTLAYAIDADGTVGGSSTFVDGMSTPYTWDVDGVRQEMILPNGASSGMVHGISNGQVAGNYLASDQTYHCFVGDAHTGATEDVETMKQAYHCQANGIDSLGEIVGIVNTDHAFSWKAGVFKRLPTFPGRNESTAWAINDAGHIVGSAVPSGGDYPHAVLWKHGVITDIGRSDRFYTTVALGINNKNIAVGEGEHRNHDHALLFERGKVIALASRVVDLGTWRLHQATGINDDGVVVGWGSYQGRRHGFMLVPQTTLR